MLVSSVQQSDSVTHTYPHNTFLLQILFPYRLSQNIEFPVLYSRPFLFIYFIYSSAYLGEGNGTPLQNSCLGNPMNGGAW